MAIQDRAGEFESRYAHDQELRFRVETRGRRLLGQWAAGHLGKLGDDAAGYAEQIVQMGLAGSSDADVKARIRKDFDAAGVDQSDHQIERHAQEALVEAEKQVAQA